MDLKITSEVQNPLFNRKELKGVIHADSPPSRLELAKFLAEKYSVPADAVKVLLIKANFGIKEFKMSANVYSTKEQRDKVELMSKKEKDLEAKSLAPVEKPAEAPAQEVTANA